MTQRCQYPPCSIEAADVTHDRIDPHYGKTLKRLLAAHAIAEKLTAIGYERSLGKVPTRCCVTGPKRTWAKSASMRS